MNRREVLEHLAYVLGVRDPSRLRRFAREYLVYQGRRGYRALAAPRRSERGWEGR